jgi:hypothetical protein
MRLEEPIDVGLAGQLDVITRLADFDAVVPVLSATRRDLTNTKVLSSHSIIDILDKLIGAGSIS